MTLNVWMNRRGGAGSSAEEQLAEGTAGVGNSMLTRRGSRIFQRLSASGTASSTGARSTGDLRTGEETQATKILIEKVDDCISPSSQATLRHELKHIAAPHDWYTESKGGESPWGQAILPPGVVYKVSTRRSAGWLVST